jgi:orotidine-5'-phosphate decarboxylase
MNSERLAISPRDRLIVALDVASQSGALNLVSELRDDVGLFKIGLQLYTSLGPEIVRAVKDSGARVFLDLKLHDIPNTVAKAVAAASDLGVDMLTIHLSGGRAMISAAAAEAGDDLLLLGVTVLTSIDAAMLAEVGVNRTIEEQVCALAHLGAECGVNGVVASPHEIGGIRELMKDRLKIVTPGVRPAWSEPGDQKRFSTPREALDAGADYLVIGRPITAHPQPREAARKIAEELSA